MKKIYKFELTTQSQQHVKMPEQATILDIEYKQNRLYLWAMIDPSLPEKDYKILTVETGGVLEAEHAVFIKTLHVVNQFKQDLVFHFFFENSYVELDDDILYLFYAEELGEGRIFHKDIKDGFYYELVDGKQQKLIDPELGYKLVNEYTLKQYNAK